MASAPFAPEQDKQPDWRHTAAANSVAVSEYDAQAILIEAQKAMPRYDIALPDDATKEQVDEAYRVADQHNAAMRNEFAKSILKRQVDAYLKGVDAATDREATRAVNIRSIVLLLVVLAVVAMPLLAMIKGLSPQDFGAYIAPVTGIAGTVVGYWFGSSERRAGKRE